MKYRVPTKRSKYWTSEADYKTAIEWCRRYPDWIKLLSTPPDTSKAISYDKDRVQTSGGYDSTADTAIRRAEIQQKVVLLEGIARAVMPECPNYLIKGVTEKGIRVEDLITLGMPFCKNTYLLKRQQFYHLLAKRI